MNNIKITSLVLILFVGFTQYSCEKEYEVDEPIACFSIKNTLLEDIISANVGEEVVFMPCDFSNDGDLYVVWTGDEGHNYQQYLDSIKLSSGAEQYVDKDQGAVVTSDVGYTYSYSTPGTYTVTWIATNNSGFGDNTKQNILEREIEIKEPQKW